MLAKGFEIVSYILLDIGVEAGLKTYLVNRGQDVEKIAFPELLRKVKEEITKTNPDLVHQVDDIGYFHGIRNKLYHQGDGIKPTEANLKKYSALAQRVVEDMIEVKLKAEEKKYVVPVRGRKYSVDQIVGHIESRFEYFKESCGIVTEKTRPAYATREFAMKLKFISEELRDWDILDLEERMELQKGRLEKFNELTGMQETSYGFVDYILEDVSHLYVIIALQQTGDKWQELWKEYTELDEQRSRLLYNWKSDLQAGRMTPEQVYENFDSITSWIEAQQKRVDEWIDGNLKDISKNWPTSSAIDMRESMV